MCGKVIILDKEYEIKVIDDILHIKQKTGIGQYQIEKMPLKFITNAEVFNKKSLEIEFAEIEEARRFKLLLNFPKEEEAEKAEKYLKKFLYDSNK